MKNRDADQTCEYVILNWFMVLFASHAFAFCLFVCFFFSFFCCCFLLLLFFFVVVFFLCITLSLSLPLGTMDWLLLVTVALPGLHLTF